MPNHPESPADELRAVVKGLDWHINLDPPVPDLGWSRILGVIGCHQQYEGQLLNLTPSGRMYLKTNPAREVRCFCVWHEHQDYRLVTIHAFHRREIASILHAETGENVDSFEIIPSHGTSFHRIEVWYADRNRADIALEK